MKEQELRVMPSEMLVLHVEQYLPEEIKRPEDVAWRFIQWNEIGKTTDIPSDRDRSPYSSLNSLCEHWHVGKDDYPESHVQSVPLTRYSIDEIDANPAFWIGQCEYCKAIHFWADPMLRSREVDVNGA